MKKPEPRVSPRGVELILKYFEELEDPRVERTRHHPLENILVMALCGAICGAEGWEDLELFAKSKAEWFSSFLEMPHGVPSADTFRRVLSALDPERFARCFSAWVAALSQELAGQVVALDGKSVRGALQRAGEEAGTPLHLVHAWASEQQLLLGQVSVEGGAPTEVAGMVKLLQWVDVKGAVVTADANGCTAAVAQAVVEAGADYVLCLKGNRGPLYEHVQQLFAQPPSSEGPAPEPVSHHLNALGKPAHGRIEVREVWAMPLEHWPLKQERWLELKSVVMVQRERLACTSSEPQPQPVLERHYYLSSLPPEAARLGSAIRSHWGVENGLHWSLDVGFNEDGRRIRDRVGAQNFALISRLALTLLKREGTLKKGILPKRKLAGWDNAYLLRVLSAGIPAN